MKKRSAFLAVALAITSVTSLAHSADRAVPDPYGTVSDGIAAATAGVDRVVVTVAGTFQPFTLNKAVEVTNTSGGEVIIDGTGTSYAAQITASGGKISNMTLKGGTTMVVDVGPGTVDNCTILDVASTLVYDYAVEISGSYGALTNSTIQRTTGPRTIRIGTGAAYCVISGCTIIDTLATSATETEVIHVKGTSAEIEGNTILVKAVNQTRYGVFLDGAGAGSALLNENFIAGAEYGVRVDNPSTTGPTITYNVIDGAKYGIYFDDAGGATTIQHNTMNRGTGDLTHGIGIRLVSGVNSGAVERNLIENVATGIVCNGASSMTYYHNILSNSDGGAATSSCSLTSTEIALKAALFCYALDGMQSATQRIDSEAAPGNNGWNELVGAKDVECGWGSLARNTTIKASSPTVTILADLTVPSGKTLTIGSHNFIEFDPVDGFSGVPRVAAVSGGGIDSGVNELTVSSGRLVVNGAAGADSVTLRSSAGTPARGDWYGIYVASGGDAILGYATIQHTTFGIYGGSTADTLKLDNSNLEMFEQDGATANNAGGSATTSLLVTGGTVTVGSGIVGIHSLSSRKLLVDGTHIVGNSSSTYGVYIDTLAVPGASDTSLVKSATITGFSTGSGIYVAKGMPLIKGNEIDGNKWGIQLRGGSVPRVEPLKVGSTEYRTSLRDNTTGVYVYGNLVPKVRKIDIRCPASGTGVYPDGSSSGTYARLNISLGATGIDDRSLALATFDSCAVDSFSSVGVKVGAATTLNIAQSEVYSPTGGVKYVKVTTPRVGGTTDVNAQNNYWHACPPSSSYFSSYVDYTNCLGSNPSPAPGSALAPVAALVTERLSAFPNPFGQGLQLQFALSAPGRTPVDLRIYDVTGRLVRTVVHADYEAGTYSLAWDGNDGQGVSAASGLYFARLDAAGRLSTRKLIKLER